MICIRAFIISLNAKEKSFCCSAAAVELIAAIVRRLLMMMMRANWENCEYLYMNINFTVPFRMHFVISSVRMNADAETQVQCTWIRANKRKTNQPNRNMVCHLRVAALSSFRFVRWSRIGTWKTKTQIISIFSFT